MAAAEGEKLRSEVEAKMREEEEGERRSRETRRKAEVRCWGECCEVGRGKGGEQPKANHLLSKGCLVLWFVVARNGRKRGWALWIQ